MTLPCAPDLAPEAPAPAPQRWLLAALAGSGLSALLLLLVVPGVVERLAQRQTFLMAFAIIVVTYLCVAAGFAVMGALSARAFPLGALGVRPVTGPYRFGVALGVAGGVLVLPALLLAAVAALTQGGVLAATLQWLGPVVLLLVTALYGLLSGTLLGLLLLRVSQAWKVALAGLFGGLIGGGVALLCWKAVHLLLGYTQTRLLLLLLLTVLLVHLCWSLSVHVALGRVARQTADAPVKPAATAPQVATVATLGFLLLLSVSGTTRSLSEFLTARPVARTPLQPPRPLNIPDCAPPIDRMERVVWTVYMREADRPDLSCSNRVQALLTMPGDYGQGAEYTTFNRLSELVQDARSEVLFTTMEYAGGEGSPGRTLTDGLAALYRKVKANPAAYPDGVSVGMTLGNYPVVPLLEWGAQVWVLLDDLRASGVPLSDPEIGWKVNLGNYDGAYPHSHVKLIVLDGQRLVTSGFNYATTHYPESRGGMHLFDLALVTDGPNAQDGAAIFDDLWQRSRTVECAGGEDREHCRLSDRGAVALQHPLSARQVVDAGESRTFSLYRRQGETQANDAQLALMQNARERLDLMQVNFSMDLACIMAVLNPSLCTERDEMPYIGAVLDATRRGLTVRLLTDPLWQPGAIENRVAVGYLRSRMRREGIPAERLQVRLFPTNLHAKATLTDNMLTVGSMNMHYSSWTQGPIGLNEAVMTTSDPGAVAQFRTLYEEKWQAAEPLTTLF